MVAADRVKDLPPLPLIHTLDDLVLYECRFCGASFARVAELRSHYKAERHLGYERL